ncbi:Gfo/Idh/MocA family protein [Microlunatus sp. Gsoil 973]|uniref:Gfo/Idh/MocA family protein n=1 Tax=Microlunatus sp. Gsoil 973 TaxID=2672569 RepID=UPI0012B4A2F3|nr:Gfo/Idh/MocA family oxidoreductase [Microlunatus sp. Gsoil 973]QGN34928.1 gfo/Idh/MocA family oxidoreductase [Microlunatus sp. Gsoil 973]
MSAPAGITVAVVGLGFGQDFVPIYLCHPDVQRVVLVESDAQRRREVAHRYGVEEGYDDIGRVLADQSVDAVHILTPVSTHADLVVAALGAGKHVASAVPMATTLDDLDRIIAAEQASGGGYMMMETAVFGREYRYVERLHRAGEFGPLTLYRGFHVQNLDGFPGYWQGFPPMHYLTHALAPVLALLDTGVATVTARGAGRLSAERTGGGFDNPFPAEVGLFGLRDSDVLADITMAFFQTGRSYIEGFAVYGERLGVEWPDDNQGPLTIHRMTGPPEGGRGNQVSVRQIEPPDDVESLPEALHRFVRPTRLRLPGMAAPVSIGAGHGGSHPFLVDEFVRSIVEGRASAINARIAARWTAPGICAHQSALVGGAEVTVPDY